MVKVTDYIIDFLATKGVRHLFGYPGGVICHFIDSLSKNAKISGHITYHEQAAAFAACGYAQEAGGIGVAYATSGPGATNLVTGIANAYYDSIPCLFFTGQVDTYGLKGDLKIRQRGFQETDVVSVVSSITKYAVRVDDPMLIRYELEKAYTIATSDNPGPVLLDLPADVQRAMVDESKLSSFSAPKGESNSARDYAQKICELLKKSNRPCILVGCGVKQSGMQKTMREIIEKLDIPAVFSMPAIDIIPTNHKNNFGFIGANGHRYGNFVLGKSDLILTVGTRLDLKQVGNNRGSFASQAQILRVDVDEDNLAYKVHDDEIQYIIDIRELLPQLADAIKEQVICFENWRKTAEIIKSRLDGYDDESYLPILKKFSTKVKNDSVITADVGQSEVWIAQQFNFADNQTFHISSGLGSMGYSLPAAIGAYYASKKPVVSFNGDGGIQMNIQELQFLARERIPISVVIINNYSLGMIRGFQEANFAANYQQTTETTGYTCPDFQKIAFAYGINYYCIKNEEDIKEFNHDIENPCIVEIVLPKETALKPNFGQTGYIQDQRPYIDRDLYEELMNL